MAFELANYTLDARYDLEMHTLTGHVLVVSISAIETALGRVELVGELPFEAWKRVEGEGAFHVDLEPGDLDGGNDGDVAVVLVLRDPLVDRLDGPDELIDLLFGEPGPLHQTEAWLLASAEQEVEVPDAADATAALGFRTRWARPFTD